MKGRSSRTKVLQPFSNLSCKDTSLQLGPQNGDEKPENANFRDKKETMMIIEAESKIRATKTNSDEIIRSRQIHKKLQDQVTPPSCSLLWI